MRRVFLGTAVAMLVVVLASPGGADSPPPPSVAIVPTPTGLGYLIVSSIGGVSAYGDAPTATGLDELAPLSAPIVGGAVTPSGNGYWLWAADGGVFSLGDARFFGSMGAVALAQPIVGGSPTPSGNGYWLWARDGGVFAFGDASFFGSMGAVALAQPVVGGSQTASGGGYWLWAADGGAFAFGDARFAGSLGAITLDQPIISAGPTGSGDGYLFVGADGGSFAFGDAAFPGSSAASGVTFIAASATPNGRGLWLLTDDGFLDVLGTAPHLGAPQAGPPSPPPPPLNELNVNVTTIASDFDQPIDIVSRSGDSSSFYVAERPGRVLRVATADVSSRTVVVDISSQTSTSDERGLLGIVFSADGSRLYLSHTDASGDLVLAEYLVDGNIANAASRRVLIEIEQPFGNHNGGDVVIGADGYIYLASGDGGGSGDPQNNAQNPANLLGTIVRIDPTPSAGLPYTVPPDNPFVGVAGARPEIWALGLRNPWRIAFDKTTGDLWIADVGQNAREEIDVIPAGEGGLNFGWRIREGSLPFAGTDAGGLTGPVFEYGRGGGCSITGGLVVADPRLSDLVGDYIFTDYCDADLRVLRVDGPDVTSASITQLPSSPVTFGEGPNGEIYVGGLGGTISRIDPAP